MRPFTRSSISRAGQAGKTRPRPPVGLLTGPLLSLAAFSTLGMLFVATGCYFGKSTETKYYVLDYLPTPPPERLAKGPYPFVLRVRDCNIVEAYRRSQIVYRQSANQMQFYSYHLWAVDPDRMIGDLVVKHLKAARLFENVTRQLESYAPDYLLSCDIQAIEEYDSKEVWYSHLAVEFQLEDTKTNQVVWKKPFDLRKVVPQQEPVFVVRELSYLVESMNERLVKELDVVMDEAKYKRGSSDSSVTAAPAEPEARGKEDAPENTEEGKPLVGKEPAKPAAPSRRDSSLGKSIRHPKASTPSVTGDAGNAL